MAPVPVVTIISGSINFSSGSLTLLAPPSQQTAAADLQVLYTRFVTHYVGGCRYTSSWRWGLTISLGLLYIASAVDCALSTGPLDMCNEQFTSVRRLYSTGDNFVTLPVFRLVA